ncbi:J domain-containing protein [Streptomyces siamensis]
MSEQREPAGSEVSGQETSTGDEASAQSVPAAGEAAQPASAGDEASEQGVAAGGEASGQEAPAGDEASTQGVSAGGESASQSAVEGDARPEARLERAVRAAEQALIEFEIAVETFRVEVDNFSRLHHQKLGPMYSRLDELEAEIAEARAARTGDPEDVRKAHEARARVMPMPGVEELFHGWMDSEGLFPEAVAMLTDQPVRPPQRVRPSEEARKLYRELARKAHPDLAQDDDERKRRDEFIARVNAAYGRGDEALLRELSAEWAAGPVPEEWKPTRSEELYARLEWLAQRKEMLAFVAQELEESAIGAMLKLAPDDPDRLLEEIAEQLLTQVGEREAELAALIAQAQ